MAEKSKSGDLLILRRVTGFGGLVCSLDLGTCSLYVLYTRVKLDSGFYSPKSNSRISSRRQETDDRNRC